jgi:YfiH family protein
MIALGLRRAAFSHVRMKQMSTASKRPPANTARMEVVRPNGWKWPWLMVGFSNRLSGHSTAFGGRDLNLGFGKHDTRDKVEKNRREFLEALMPNGVSRQHRLVTLRQFHSDVIHTIQAAPRELPVGDGMITNVPGLLLAAQVADCVPVLLVDVRRKAVGALHAGWRGTVKRIVEKGVGAMRMEYESDPSDIHAAIGPCIMQCCYAVGEEVIEKFESQFAYAKLLFDEVYDADPVKRKYPLLFMTARPPGHSDTGPQIHLDLVEANRRQLIDTGVPAKNIWSADLCTSCNTDRLFSHRKEGGFTGRMMGAVGIAPLSVPS